MSGNVTTGDVLALGEAPGAEEDRNGEAFVGKSGAILRRVIPGRDLDRVCFQNTVRCRPAGNATPTARDMHACSVHLEADIEALPLKAILGIGSIPLSYFYPGQLITKLHGVRFPVRIGSKVVWFMPVLHPSFILRTGEDRSPAMSVLRADVKRFFREMHTWGKPTIWDPQPTSVLTPHSYEEAKGILVRMQGPLGLDLETQRLKPYLRGASLLTAAVSDGETTMAWPIAHPEGPTPWGLRLLLEIASTRQWIAHNANFELVWMLFKAAEAGIPFVPHQFEDSQAVGRLWHERESIISLEMLTRIHLGTNVKSMTSLNINNMAAEPLNSVLPYNGLDAQASALLFKLLRPALNTENYDRFVQTVDSTARMELRGLPADLDTSRALKTEWQTKMDNAVDRVKTVYEVRQFEATRSREFNIASGDDVGQALVEFGRVPLPKTSKKGEDGVAVTGARWSTDDKHLTEFAAGNPLALAVIDYREASKQISTYIDSTIRHCADAIDGLLHPSYTCMFTATTRLSARDPSIQNYPRRRHREPRRQVVPGKGMIFLAADYAGIDARIYGCATKDRALVESFINGEDIHAYWRDQMLKLHPAYLERLARETNETDEKRILKGARDIMKSDFVFASFYGSVARGISDKTNIPLEVVTEVLSRFWKRYPEAYRWLKNQRQIYADTGAIHTLCGVVRRGLHWGNEMINTPIQGTTAHVVNDALNALSQLSLAVDDPHLHPRLQIHDDLTFIIPDNDDRIEEYVKVIAAEMVKVRYDWQIVPFQVEFKIGTDWADLEEIAVVKGEHVR